MLHLGKTQELKISHFASVGAYLIDPAGNDDTDSVLLPRKEVPSEVEAGDHVTVFLYRDSEDRLTATLSVPEIQLGEIKKLEVAEVTKIGAFLKWGLLKDLLLPYSEQTGDIKKGRKYLVALYIDKSGRLCATMKFSKHFDRNPNYNKNDIVDCTVYDVNPDLGAFVIVDGKYEGLIIKNVLVQNLKAGDVTEARVIRVREDGRLDLSQLESVKVRMDADSQKIWDALGDSAGRLPFNDKTPPEEIMNEFGMSKRAFKRAVGQLLKSGKIILTDDGMEMK